MLSDAAADSSSSDPRDGVNKLESEMERKLALRQRLHGIREELRRSANNPISKD
jgi:hypothetical protein